MKFPDITHETYLPGIDLYNSISNMSRLISDCSMVISINNSGLNKTAGRLNKKYPEILDKPENHQNKLVA